MRTPQDALPKASPPPLPVLNAKMGYLPVLLVLAMPKSDIDVIGYAAKAWNRRHSERSALVAHC